MTTVSTPSEMKAHVRGRVVLKDFDAVEGGARLTFDVTAECGSEDRPACVAESIALVYV